MTGQRYTGSEMGEKGEDGVMRVCLFDIDGTLVNSGGAGQAAMESALAGCFGITRPTEGISTVGRSDLAITQDLLAFHGLETSDVRLQQFLEAYLVELPAQLAQLDGVALPGVAVLLERLSEQDEIVLGLLTGNFVRGARCKLAHFDLDQFFEREGDLFGGFGDDERERDDVARRAWEVARSALGPLDPEQVWVIGDTPLDVQCARAISARVLAVGTGVFSVSALEATQPDALLADLEATEQVIDLLVS